MIEFQLKGYTKELEFGYNTKVEGYTNLSLDIIELSEIGFDHLNNHKIDSKTHIIPP